MTVTKFAVEPEKPEIVMTSVLDAPPERVFRVYTDPRLVSEWWGPRYLTTTVDRMDVRPGGAWRFVQHDAGGNEYAFNGVYRAVVPPERLVYTFEFEGMPGHVVLETVTFEAQPGGKTKLTDTSVFQSVEDRDGMLQSGMEAGAVETIERLAEVLGGAGIG